MLHLSGYPHALSYKSSGSQREDSLQFILWSTKIEIHGFFVGGMLFYGVV
jgi:hypothetical protein